jgi:hypothetical protein
MQAYEETFKTDGVHVDGFFFYLSRLFTALNQSTPPMSLAQSRSTITQSAWRNMP